MNVEKFSVFITKCPPISHTLLFAYTSKPKLISCYYVFLSNYSETNSIMCVVTRMRYIM